MPQLPEILTREGIKGEAEKDGLGIIKDGTFSPAFAKLIKRNYITEETKGKAGIPSTYRKVERPGTTT